MSEAKIPDLMEMGTRYAHYTELLDLFRTGVEIMNNLSKVNPLPPLDERKKAKLEGAVDVIEGRLDFMTKFDFKQADLRKTINTIPKVEPLLLTE